MPPKKKKAAGRKRARSTQSSTRTDTPALPTDIAQKVQECINGIDLELHQDNLDSLAAHVWEEMRIQLSEREEAYCEAATNASELADHLAHAISLAWHRQQKADSAFALLDESDKGVIVVEDLRRVVGGVVHDEQWTDQDLEEMVREIDQSGDGLLTKDDFYRLAAKINL